MSAAATLSPGTTGGPGGGALDGGSVASTGPV